MLSKNIINKIGKSYLIYLFIVVVLAISFCFFSTNSQEAKVILEYTFKTIGIMGLFTIGIYFLLYLLGLIRGY